MDPFDPFRLRDTPRRDRKGRSWMYETMLNATAGFKDKIWPKKEKMQEPRPWRTSTPNPVTKGQLESFIPNNFYGSGLGDVHRDVLGGSQGTVEPSIVSVASETILPKLPNSNNHVTCFPPTPAQTGLITSSNSDLIGSSNFRSDSSVTYAPSYPRVNPSQGYVGASYPYIDPVNQYGQGHQHNTGENFYSVSYPHTPYPSVPYVPVTCPQVMKTGQFMQTSAPPVSLPYPSRSYEIPSFPIGMANSQYMQTSAPIYKSDFVRQDMFPVPSLAGAQLPYIKPKRNIQFSGVPSPNLIDSDRESLMKNSKKYNSRSQRRRSSSSESEVFLERGRKSSSHSKKYNSSKAKKRSSSSNSEHSPEKGRKSHSHFSNKSRSFSRSVSSDSSPDRKPKSSKKKLRRSVSRRRHQYSSDSDRGGPQKMTIPRFDGSSTYEFFKIEWLNVAKNYRWRSHNRVAQLLTSITGKAKNTIGIPKDVKTLTEESIWSDLDRRFLLDPDFDSLNEQLIERKQYKNESYEELGMSILNLVRRLEPDSDIKSQDRRALAHFVKALTDEYVREWTKNKHCKTLDEAIRYANSIARTKTTLNKSNRSATVRFSDENLVEDVKVLNKKIENLSSNNSNQSVLSEINRINKRIDALSMDSRNNYGGYPKYDNYNYSGGYNAYPSGGYSSDYKGSNNRAWRSQGNAGQNRVGSSVKPTPSTIQPKVKQPVPPKESAPSLNQKESTVKGEGGS